jgi:hypothetical protein
MYTDSLKAFDRTAANDILTSALSMPLDAAVSTLCDSATLERLIDEKPQSDEQFMAKVRKTLDAGLRERNEEALREIHQTLFILYDLHVADGASPRTLNQFNPTLTRLRNEIERQWLHDEVLRLGALVVPSDSQQLVHALKDLWSQHPVSSHGLFDFLEREASLEQIVAFFRSDSALNIRFFDTLLYSMLGSRDGVRKELVQNLWDESGRGEPKQSHVRLFRHLLDVVGLGQAHDNHAGVLGWQGLAGYNLFMLASLNRRHYFKLLGIMSMTELLDPSQYEKLARGCRRVGLGRSNELDYYDEHVTIDVVHGEGWLSNVIVPIVDETPSAGPQILLGAALRLATCNDYYNELYVQLVSLSTQQFAQKDAGAVVL